MFPAPATLREQGGGSPEDKVTRKHLTASTAHSGPVVGGDALHTGLFHGLETVRSRLSEGSTVKAQ